MDPARLSRDVRERALASGFDLVGVARATRPERDADALAEWVRNGFNAGMEWMSRHLDQRTDPAILLPGCRSIVSLAVNYLPEPSEPRRPIAAQVARYAHGRDYHRVLGKRLRRLAGWLEERSGEPSRAFLDTGPVLERAWAERSGIGWIGKNGNLVSRTHGSWLLLGEIVTAAVLEPDAGPHPDFCGTCAACLEACPTGAIREAGVVDSRLCISYWTIEHRGPVPSGMRSGIGEWIFGCDDCQSVCPWSRRFGRPATADPLEVRDEVSHPDPVEILGMDEASFRARFSGTSFMRARWDGMRRNACIVLGNQRDPSGEPALVRALADPDPVVREHARWALHRIRGAV